MELRELVVVHRRKYEEGTSRWVEAVQLSLLEEILNDSFRLDTCLRTVWMTREGDRLKRIEKDFVTQAGFEFLRGEQAYLLLLRIGAGLESAIPGETDVFGQMKEAGRKFETQSPRDIELTPWIQRIYEDVKDVRSRFLQGIGGGSYGSLTRMLMGKEASGPTLLVGAGQMARSVAPYIATPELWITNRTPLHAEALKEKLKTTQSKLEILPYENEFSLWTQAKEILVCVPSDEVRDVNRVEAWLRGAQSDRSVIHLGIVESQNTAWAKIPHLLTLKNLFALQAQMTESRSVQLQAAERACIERAKLRNLSASTSVPHGWEDLAYFTGLIA